MQTQFLQLEHGTIAYDLQGVGPLVVCAPSLGDIRQEYRFLAPKLAEAGFRVATLDLRGHGESSAGWPEYSVAGLGQDILALIRHLQSGPALVIGTSLSAGAAVYAAAEGPGLVSGLVLIGMFVRDVAPLWQGRLLYGALFGGPWGRGLWVRYYQTLYPSRKPADFEAYLAQLQGMVSQPGRLAAVRRMITSSKQASEDRLEKVQAPTLLIVGTQDPDFKDPLAEAHLVAGRLNGQVASVPGAGHYPHAEMPEETAALILPFARRVQNTAAQPGEIETTHVA